VSGMKRDGSMVWLEGMNPDDGTSCQQWLVDYDYAETLGLTINAGRDFSAAIRSDSQAVVISELLAKRLNLHNPVGQIIFNHQRAWTVIGVMEDFHFKLAKQSLEPVALFIGQSPGVISVKVSPTNMHATLDRITALWNIFSPHQPIRYAFLDERYARMYDDIRRMETLFTGFALLAISIACLGLFALSTFMIEQRNKEVSIRLVLGASISSIYRLLTRNFAGLVVIAFVIAAPAGWYLMTLWLEDYIYKTEIGYGIFLIVAVLSLLITFTTISYQAIRVALSKPIRYLRSG